MASNTVIYGITVSFYNFKNCVTQISDATFSENFYGLKRVLDNGNTLTSHHRRISLLFCVLLPYFKRKLDEKVALYRLENADGCLHNVCYQPNSI